MTNNEIDTIIISTEQDIEDLAEKTLAWLSASTRDELEVSLSNPELEISEKLNPKLATNKKG